MTRAEEVLKAMAEVKKKPNTAPLRIKDKEGVRRRQSAQLSLSALLAATKKLRPGFNKHNKIELSSAILHPRAHRLVLRAQVKSLTDDTRKAYPIVIVFFRVSSKEKKDKEFRIPVELGGQTVYIKQLSVADNPVNIRCGCQDFFWTWNWYNFKNKALTGPRVPLYTRKTPPPPEGLPYRNPIGVPGLCKHLHGTMQKLVQMKILGN